MNGQQRFSALRPPFGNGKRLNPEGIGYGDLDVISVPILWLVIQCL